MPSSNGYQGLLKLGVSLITISFTFGLNCSQCIDIRNVQVLKNTVPDNYNLAVDQSKLPRSLLCESAKNGETVDGVSVVECQNSSSGSSKEFRCVHYNGVLDSSVEVEIGSASGEVMVRYEGTYRDCILDDFSENGYCTTLNASLPKENTLRVEALSSLPKVLMDLEKAVVKINGIKCVSNINGTFDAVRNIKCNAAMTECSILAIVLFYFISQV